MSDFQEIIRRNQEMLDRVIGPAARKVEDMNRYAQRVQETYENLIGPAMRKAEEMNGYAQRVQEAYENLIRPAIQMAEDMARMVVLAEQRNQKFATLVRKLKWPPPGHLPCTVIDRIADAYSSGQLSDTEVEDLFIQAYSPRILGEIERKWASYGWLADRLPILQEALANYPDGRYHSVVCTLMPQLEGISGTEFGRKPKPKDDAPAVFGESPHGALVSDYYLQVILETFDAWNPTSPVPDLSRHAILHGRATGYGTKAHALKLIIVTDYLLASFEARRNGTC